LLLNLDFGAKRKRKLLTVEINLLLESKFFLFFYYFMFSVLTLVGQGQYDCKNKLSGKIMQSFLTETSEIYDLK
jgi:hypothetical protein